MLSIFKNTTMEQMPQPFETRGHDLTGNASLEFNDLATMHSFADLIPGMDMERFDPVALKIFISGETPLITLYAKQKNDNSSSGGEKVPVRKYKSPITWNELFKLVKSFDIVVHDGNFNIADMEVDRK